MMRSSLFIKLLALACRIIMIFLKLSDQSFHAYEMETIKYRSFNK